MLWFGVQLQVLQLFIIFRWVFAVDKRVKQNDAIIGLLKNCRKNRVCQKMKFI